MTTCAGKYDNVFLERNTRYTRLGGLYIKIKGLILLMAVVAVNDSWSHDQDDVGCYNDRVG